MRAKSDLRSAQQRTITRLYVDEALAYDPETGVLTWRERPLHHFKHALAQRCWNNRFAGKVAGNKHVKRGYLEVKLLGAMRKAHHLIWLLVHGYPPERIDHENGQRAYNRLTNLREVTRVENGRNQKRPVTNTSGHAGVSKDRRGGKWRAYIKDDNGRNISLGYYHDLDAAVAARKAAEQQLGYHPNHGRN